MANTRRNERRAVIASAITRRQKTWVIELEVMKPKRRVRGLLASSAYAAFHQKNIAKSADFGTFG